MAFLAISVRFLAESFVALALPPLDAPNLDRATAAGFRVSSSSGSGGAWPVASCTICQASWLVSRGRFFLLARVGMAPGYHRASGCPSGLDFKLDHYPLLSLSHGSHGSVNVN